ncbi:hypothetical protein NEOLI_005303 [Neolecta irregularis DAH-3]|uniref:Ribosome biogenesis protein NOP53 n=1 Tax=Neolecta irregularis (strain DAH-3) TaxID=1198029 RepID=A0A1U7LJU4_NEOID|nr:hypothetical protein NEOLI_005303 [Neolecta irregularis DAH-3]|eukprot:OLL22936.1 hypothetical protein NEOLI_005303 [Neolecta irregularis DAH-3]
MSTLSAGSGKPSQKKQPSRKGKKAWRKHIDLEQIEFGIEEIRQEIILGYIYILEISFTEDIRGVINEKPNEQLFAIDVCGDKNAAKNHLRSVKPLKVDEILAARSAVKSLTSISSKSSRLVTDGLPRPSGKISKISRVELERLKLIAKRGMTAGSAKTQAAMVAREFHASRDIWSLPVESYMTVKHLQHPPVRLAENAQKIPAIQIADRGMSYNPVLQEWVDLVHKTAESITEKVPQAMRIRDHATEIQESLEQLHAKEERVDDDMNTEKLAVEEKATAKRKTRVQRNKEAKRAARMRQEQENARRKCLAMQVERVDEIAADIESPNQNDGITFNQVEDVAEDKPLVLRKRKFGKISILQRPIEVQLSDELAADFRSLKNSILQRPIEIQLSDELAADFRSLKPEGNLFRDRYNSILERGLVEARQPQVKRRRYPVKWVEKYTYKDFK